MSRNKKFKNVKWDKPKEFRKQLKQYNISKEAIKLIETVSVDNIEVVIFNSLLKDEGLDYKKYKDYTSLMKLYSARVLLDSLNDPRNESIKWEVEAALKQAEQKVNLETNDIVKTQHEKTFIDKYHIDEKTAQEYFASTELYKKIADIFATVLKSQNVWDYAYEMAMYVELELFSNEYLVPDNYNLFLLKLDLQQDMIKRLTYITPKNYNTIIINMNKWLIKNIKTFYKLFFKEEGDK